MLILVSEASTAVVLFRLSVPLLLMPVSPLLPVVLFRLTVPPLTYNVSIALPAAPLLRVVTAEPLLARVPVTTLFVIVVSAAPEKLTVPVPVIGTAPLSRLVPPAKFSVALAALLKLPVWV